MTADSIHRLMRKTLGEGAFTYRNPGDRDFSLEGGNDELTEFCLEVARRGSDRRLYYVFLRLTVQMIQHERFIATFRERVNLMLDRVEQQHHAAARPA